MLLRNPHYPVIIVSADQLRSAKSLKGLAEACLISSVPDNSRQVIAIDITGDEFWYTPGSYVIWPGFIHKPLTKKRMIDLYNESANARDTGVLYSDRSLGNKTLARISTDLCELIRLSNRRR